MNKDDARSASYRYVISVEERGNYWQWTGRLRGVVYSGLIAKSEFPNKNDVYVVARLTVQNELRTS